MFYKISAALFLMLAVAAGIYFYSGGSIDWRAGVLASDYTNTEDMPLFVLDAKVGGASPGESVERPERSAESEDSNRDQLQSYSHSVFSRRSWSPSPSVSATAMAVADLEMGGSTYFKHAEEKRWPLASLTKLITATVVKKHIHPDVIIRLTEEDFSFGKNAYTASLQPGSAYRADDLLDLMLTSSSNAAAKAFMRTMGEEVFIGHMNRQAKQWGLQDTYVTDPAGLYASNQSTVKDVITLARRLYQYYPDILQRTAEPFVTMEDAVTGERQRFRSTHPFAGAQQFLGGKTGETREAKQNLLSLFYYDGAPVAVVVLGSQNRMQDTRMLLNWFQHDFITSN